MTNNKQQTAVDWYIEKLLDLDYEYAKGLITLAVWSERKKSLIEQAKEMEKEQIKNAFCNGDNTDCTSEQNIEEFAEQYYNETYRGGEQ